MIKARPPMHPLGRSLRILVADDHPMVRRGLTVELATHPGWAVVGEAENGRDAVRLAGELQPDLVILDISMPLLNGLEAARQIRRAAPRAEILALTVHDSEELARALLEAGVRGYVSKADAPRILVQAVEALAARRPFVTPSVSRILVQDPTQPPLLPSVGLAVTSPLTPRERETLQLIAEGRTNKEIATGLGISLKTAETHRGNLMRKLDLHSASDLTRYAIRNRIIEA